MCITLFGQILFRYLDPNSADETTTVPVTTQAPTTQTGGLVEKNSHRNCKFNNSQYDCYTIFDLLNFKSSNIGYFIKP